MNNLKLSKLRSFARTSHADRDGGDAFVPDFRHGFVPVSDGDAEAFGEEFVAAATSGEAVGETARDELLDEELNGLGVEISYDEIPNEEMAFDLLDIERKAS